MIECEHVYKQYKNGTNALYDVNFSVKQGEFVYIIGPTGSGKSTLIKLLDGEELPTKGNVEVVGINVGELKRKQVPIYRRNIGVVFQDFRLLPTKTVYENIAYALEVINMKKPQIKKRVDEVLDVVSLKEKKTSFPHELSGGQQQRIAIARAIASNVDLIFADEPTGNLDSATEEEIIKIFKMLTSEFGKTVIVVTHSNEVSKLSDHRVLLHDGVLQEI